MPYHRKGIQYRRKGYTPRAMLRASPERSRFILRIDSATWEKFRTLAARDERSINALVVDAIHAYIRADTENLRTGARRL